MNGLTSKSRMATGLMMALAAMGSGVGVAPEPRLQHARKAHPRQDAYGAGVWRDPAWSPAATEKANHEMSVERWAHKAKKLEEGRQRLARGERHPFDQAEVWQISSDRAVVTAWG